MMTPEDYLELTKDLPKIRGALVTRLALTPDMPTEGPVTLEFRGFDIFDRTGLGENAPLWAVVWHEASLTRKQEWLLNPMPSSRSDWYLKQTRFTFEAALSLWESAQSSAWREFPRRWPHR